MCSSDLSEALRRRCLYLWIDYPTLEKELRIVRLKVPGAGNELAAQVVAFMQSLRKLHLSRLPGVAETLDWATALVALGADTLDETLVRETLGCLLKDRGDAEHLARELDAGGFAAMVSVLV